MRIYYFYLVLFFSLYSCKDDKQTTSSVVSQKTSVQDDIVKMPSLNFHIDTPICDEKGCEGSYSGPEFVMEKYVEQLHLTGTDFAHNFSNLMSKYVGEELKSLFNKGVYVQVDFSKIEMITQGMRDGDDSVYYYLKIPFKKVKNKSQAMTGFDHSGGWGHAPAINARKTKLINANPAIVKYKKLYISPLMKTPEGLQEYWIQWKHAAY
jgi:hypothetical protein